MTESGADDGPTETELWEGLRTRDAASYDEIVRRYRGRMFGVASHIVRNTEDALAWVQEALLDAFTTTELIEGRSSLWTWLHRIVVHSALLKLRSRRGKSEPALDELMPQYDESGCRVEATRGAQAPVETIAGRKGVRDAVQEALDALPEEYRTLLILRDIEGFANEETAELMHLSPETVKTKLHRARAGLKKLLEYAIPGEPK